MSRKNTAKFESLIVATLLATGAIAPTAASAQEAITLETIGAVRMAQPRAVERSRSHVETRTPASREVGRVERRADNR